MNFYNKNDLKNIKINTVESNQGDLYTITTGVQSVPANGFVVLQLTNPAKSGKAICVYWVLGGATANTTLDVFRDAMFTAAGTTMTPENMNWAFENSSVMTAKFLAQSTDPTIGGTLLSSVAQIGGTITKKYDGPLIIPSSKMERQFYLRLANNTNNSNLCSLNVMWRCSPLHIVC